MVEIETLSDQRLFVVMCALNLCGYDKKFESNMHPIRKDVRGRLKEKKLECRSRLCEFIKNTPKWRPIKYSYSLGPAPEFEIKSPIEKDLNDMKGLENILNSFYKEASIGDIWKDVKEEHDSYNQILFESIKKNRALERISDLIRIEIPFERIICSVSLLESHYSATSFDFEEKIFIVTGPHPEERSDGYAINFVHELLHPIIKPELEKHEGLISSLSELKEQIPKNSQADHYGSWDMILEETIIRALVRSSLFSPSVREREIEKVREMGFVHIDRISEGIERYKSTEENFLEYIPELLRNLGK